MDNILKNLEKHVYPKTIEEIMNLLQDETAVLLAGGTGLTLETNDIYKTLVDLKDTELSYIKEDESTFYIGAMTSATEILFYEPFPESLREAARWVGDRPVINAVTIGGNLAKLYPWVDLPPMLWALDAKIVLYGPEKKIMNSDEFFAYSNERNIFSRRELIAEVQIPKSETNSFSKYQTLTQTSVDKGQLNLAFCASWNGSSITDVRIVISAAVHVPTRLTEVENLLSGKNLAELNDTLFDNLDLTAIELKNDFKSSVEYRRKILRVYLKRALKGLLEGIRG